MENMGELVEQRDLEEPIPMEGVDSPVQNAQVSERREQISPEHAVIVAVRSERPPCKDEDQEVLSVIVSPRADSRDSELLSPTSASMIDASEFRMQSEPTYQTLTSMVDRGISPAGLSPNSSYATLTPLQPLPPISTVSDKFAYGHAGSVSGSFTVMQNNLSLGYGYEKMGVSPHYSTPALGLGIPHSPLSPQSPYSQGLQSPQKSMSPTGYESPNYQRTLTGPQSPALSPPSASLHSPVNSSIHFGGTPTNLNGISTMTPHSTPLSPQHSPNMGVQREMVESPSPPSVIHKPPSQGKTIQNEMAVNVVLNTPATSEVEEINTKELAQRISAELKRYSIPQAIFAQRVLCRSQGTLSDLLRNPKPWSKLKSGRETFRRMWKWLQEPEFQRMSALRLADCQMRSVNVRAVNAKRRKPTSSSCFKPKLRHWKCHVTRCKGNKTWGSCTYCTRAECSKCTKEVIKSAQTPHRGIVVGVKRREETATGGSDQITTEHNSAPKKPRLVFTDLQRRTLQAIFKETKRPSKEMQVTIARQLGLEPTTVGNFFMNARRRSMDKWRDEEPPKETPQSSGGIPTAAAAAAPTTTHQTNAVLHDTGGPHEEL